MTTEKHIMIMKDAFNRYKQNYPGHKIAFTSFSKLKPPQVKRVSETSKRSCLCVICCNVALKAEAMTKLVNSSEDLQNISKDLKLDKKELSSLTLCSYDEKLHPMMKCLERKCQDCGPGNISKHYKDVQQWCITNDTRITWHKWEYINIQKNNDKQKRIMSCVQKQTSVLDFLQDYELNMINYPGHIFRADWQHNQMSNCLKNVKDGQLIMIMDFAENYKCSFQNEVQCAYFDQNMVTIHSMMCYYKKKIDGEDSLIKHSIIGISDDLKHDNHAVSMFEENACKIIEQNIEIKEIIQWTDGCGAQYKSKNCFLDISNQRLSKTRNYFETSHGKNVCDGLGATVKNSCYKAMLSQKVIENAESVFNHCKEKLENLKGTVNPTSTMFTSTNGKSVSLRQFIFLKSLSINRENITELAPVQGTTKIHAVQNKGTPGNIKHRNLSCYCSGCQKDGVCENSEHVNNWQSVKLITRGQSSKKANTKDNVKKGNTQINSTPPAQSTSSMSVESHASGARGNSNEKVAESICDGDYVQVALWSSKTKFITQVVESDRNEIHLAYMKERVKTNKPYYIWNDTEHSWESKYVVVKKIDDKIDDKISSNRIIYYYIDV